jgi:hypothetical protein
MIGDKKKARIEKLVEKRNQIAKVAIFRAIMNYGK